MNGKLCLICHKTLILGHKLTNTFHSHVTNNMADYVVKTCLGTDEKDRFISNLNLYRSYIAIIEYNVDLLRYILLRKTGKV
jgi:RNase P subunit RPR2